MARRPNIANVGRRVSRFHPSDLRLYASKVLVGIDARQNVFGRITKGAADVRDVRRGAPAGQTGKWRRNWRREIVAAEGSREQRDFSPARRLRVSPGRWARLRGR